MMSVPSNKNACNTYQPAKKRRGELRAVALKNRREPGQTTSLPRSSERLRGDSSNVGLPHKSLAENCGFRIIREDSAGKCDLYSESDQSEATSVQTTPSCPSRWSLESCYDPEETRQQKKVLKEFVVVSKRNDNTAGSVSGSLTAEKQQTYKVSRKCESSTEPKVDYLDMTDSNNTVGTYHTPNNDLCSRNRTITGRSTPAYTITQEDKNVEVDSDKPGVKYRIIRHEQTNTSNGKMTDKGKASNRLKNNNQKVTPVSKDEDCQFELSRFPPLKPKIKVHLSPDHNSPLLLNDAHSHVKTRPDIRNIGHKPCRDGKTDVQMFTLTTANDFKEAGVRDRDSRISRLSSESKKNTHSSTKEPENVRDERRAQKKRRKEGGMHYLRQKGINTSLVDKRNETIVIGKRSVASFDKRDEINLPTNCQRSHGQDKENPEELHATLSNRRHVRHRTIVEKICRPFHREIEKISPLSRRHKLRLKALPVRTKLTAHISPLNSRSSNNKGSSYCLSRKLPTELPFSSVGKKTIQSVALRFDENPSRDYNFNFNSEDECDDKTYANSFIGHYLYELWKHQCLCDVRLKVGNSSFLAHKIVLAAFSDIFCPEDPQQVPALCFDIPDVTEEALCLILQYLYTSEMEITDSALEPVYTAASILEIHEITDLVAEILSKPSVENFEKYMTIRQNVGLPTGIMDFKEFIRDNLMDIADSSFILNISYNELENLLRDPDVKIESEEDIMKFIIRWLEFNPCKRSKYAADLLTLVNFDCIGPENLSAIVEQSKHILDMSAMELIMGAFKSFALRNAEDTSCSAKSRINFKNGKSKRRPGYCNDDESALERPGIVHNWKPSDSYECDESPYSECPESFSRDREAKSRISHVKSIQEIREAARRSCWGKCKDFPSCDRCESNPRRSKPDSTASATNQEITYTIRKKRNFPDSNCFRPPEYREERARSSSLESRCDHRPSPSRSESDLDLMTCNNCACKSQRKAGQSSRTAGASDRGGQNNRGPDECSSNLDIADRPAHGGRGAARATHKCQMWSTSRSSSRSSGSSRRHNTSSSGSSKRVTFR